MANPGITSRRGRIQDDVIAMYRQFRVSESMIEHLFIYLISLNVRQPAM
jgi:hypothetical protein